MTSGEGRGLVPNTTVPVQPGRYGVVRATVGATVTWVAGLWNSTDSNECYTGFLLDMNM